MAVQAGAPWEHDGFKFIGVSLSGIRTSLTYPAANLCFDVAQGLPFAMNMKKYFLTHGHLDHASGVPYIIGQKAMQNDTTPHFYMPASLVEPLTEIMRIWGQIEGHQYRFQFHPVQADSRFEINPQYEIRAFKTVHRVESFGYSFVHKFRKLKKEFHHLDQTELRHLRSQNVEISEKQESTLFSFTGDTQIEFLDCSPQTRQAKILFLEATYLDERKTVEQAKAWGHTHLDEIIPRLSEIESEKIVLIHVSSRYSTREAHEILKRKIPEHEHERVVLFPGR